MGKYEEGFRRNTRRDIKIKESKMDKENQLHLLRALLNQIKIDDPYLRQLLEQQMGGFQPRKTRQENTKEIIRCLRIQNKKLLEQVANLKNQLKEEKVDREELRSNLNYLSKLNNSLSEALGSCNLCWGEDPDCNNCKGNGLPGWRKTNKRLFNIYVLPCLEKLYGLIKE